MDEQNESGVRIDASDAGEEFLAEEVAVSHSPVRFVIDFKSMSPRIDIPGQPIRHILKHKIIKLDPFIAKDLLDVFRQNIEKYEKQYGKIEKPKALAKAEEEAKKQGKAPHLKQDYFG
jgi:hypothetical protein